MKTPYRRKNSLRKPGYDYASDGAYFVTICTHQRLHFFGEIENGEMRLSKLGEIVADCWLQIPSHHSMVDLDVYVVMPNHIHGIVIINHDDRRGMIYHAPTTREFSKPVAKSISSIIGTFKAAVTRSVNLLPNAPETPIWQRNFHDRIIRNQREYEIIATYVENNPTLWEQDRFFA